MAKIRKLLKYLLLTKDISAFQHADAIGRYPDIHLRDLSSGLSVCPDTKDITDANGQNKFMLA